MNRTKFERKYQKTSFSHYGELAYDRLPPMVAQGAYPRIVDGYGVGRCGGFVNGDGHSSKEFLLPYVFFAFDDSVEALVINRLVVPK